MSVRCVLVFGLVAAAGCKRSPPPPAPITTKTLYVHALSIPVHEKPGGRVVGSLPIGAKVTLKPSGEISEALIAGKKISGGFVEASELQPQPPDYASIWGEAKRMLVEQNIEAARAEAERAAALKPSQSQPWELLQAVYDQRHDVENARRVYRAVKALKLKSRPAILVPNAGQTPAAGDDAFVTGTKLRIRAEKSTTAAIVAELLINERVHVEERSAEWARVKTDIAEGWVALRFLSTVESTSEQLLQRARTSEDPREAAVLYERAAAADPGNASTWKALRVAAVKAEEWQLAVSAAMAEVAAGEDGRIVELEQVWGCKGVRERAIVVDGALHELPAGAENVCVTAFSQARPCAPCFDTYRECGCLGGIEDPKEMEEATKSFMACEARVMKEEQEANDAYLAETEGLDAWLEKLSGFEKGPWVRVTVRGAPKQAGRSLFVFQKNGDDYKVLEPALDEPSPGKRVVRWVPAQPGITGVVEAASADEARANLPAMNRTLQFFDDSNECPPCIKT